MRRALRRRLPTAHELVGDNDNFPVTACGAMERPGDCFLSLAAEANGVSLCLLHGATLPDPAGVLAGAGRQTRMLRVPAVQRLQEPAVVALLTRAAERARTPLPHRGGGALILRGISARQRPRRRPAAARD